MSARKRLHWFALTLWVFAILYLLVLSPTSWYLYRNAAEIAQASPRPGLQASLTRAAWDTFTGGLVTSLELAAAGFLIELLDAVRWNLSSLEQRVVDQ